MDPNKQFPVILWVICPFVCMSCFVSQVHCVPPGWAGELSFWLCSSRDVGILSHTARWCARGQEVRKNDTWGALLVYPY